MSARRAIAGLAPLAVAISLAGAAGASAASSRAVDGRAAPATPAVHSLDGRAATATPAVHSLDGRAARPAPAVRLTVDFTRRGGVGHQIAHVQCTAAGNRVDGFLRAVGARRACATARRIAGLLASGPDPHRACTQIYGGPERALVTGTIGSRRIHRGFSRTNGCGVSDWRRAMPLLPRPG
jgi:hypothetical protein